MADADFCFGQATVLRVSGPAGVVRGFEREYGAPSEWGSEPDVHATFGPVAGVPALAARHKTVAWRVELSDPRARRLSARLQVRGHPRPFARSLLQGYVVEPLLSLAIARSGQVLLPGAALQD